MKTVQAFCASPFAGIRRERRCSESRTAHRAANAELWGDDCRPAERKQPASARPFHNRAPLCDAEPPLCRHGASCRAAGGVSPHRGGEKRVCSGFLGKPLPKPKPVLTRPAAARFAPEGRRAAHLRVPRSRRGPADRRPAERSAPGPAQKRRFHPRPGGRCAKEKDRSNLPSFFVHILRSAPDFPARPIRSAPETATSGRSGSGRRTRPRGTANRRPSRRKRRPRRSSAAAPAPDSARCGRSASTRPK